MSSIIPIIVRKVAYRQYSKLYSIALKSQASITNKLKTAIDEFTNIRCFCLNGIKKTIK